MTGQDGRDPAPVEVRREEDVDAADQQEELAAGGSQPGARRGHRGRLCAAEVAAARGRIGRPRTCGERLKVNVALLSVAVHQRIVRAGRREQTQLKLSVAVAHAVDAVRAEQVRDADFISRLAELRAFEFPLRNQPLIRVGDDSRGDGGALLSGQVGVDGLQKINYDGLAIVFIQLVAFHRNHNVSRLLAGGDGYCQRVRRVVIGPGGGGTAQGIVNGYVLAAHRRQAHRECHVGRGARTGAFGNSGGVGYRHRGGVVVVINGSNGNGGGWRQGGAGRMRQPHQECFAVFVNGVL